MKKQTNLYLNQSSTSINTWPRLCLQFISSPQIVFDTNTPSNITYQIPNDLLCVFNFTSSLSVFLPSPGCQIYVSTFYHKRYGYRWWLLLTLFWGDSPKSIELVNRLGPCKHGWPFINDIFICILFKDMFYIVFSFQRIWLLFVQSIMNHYWSDLGDRLTAGKR